MVLRVKNYSPLKGKAIGKVLRYAIIATVSASIGSCATTPTGEDVKSAEQRPQDGLTSRLNTGIDRLGVLGPSQANKDARNTSLIVSKFPLNEVPHTLLKKPAEQGKLTSGYGRRLSPTGVPRIRKHEGVDYAAPTGTPIFAAGDGTIDKHYVSKSYGNYIRIQHENDFYTAYAHMDAFTDGLSIGSPVTQGQIIGTIGSTGRSSGPHLHFELIHKDQFLDPLFESTLPTEVIASDS